MLGIPLVSRISKNITSSKNSVDQCNLSQNTIDSHQTMIENQLNLVPTSNANKDSNSDQPPSSPIIPGVNAPLPIVLKKRPTKKTN